MNQARSNHWYCIAFLFATSCRGETYNTVRVTSSQEHPDPAHAGSSVTSAVQLAPGGGGIANAIAGSFGRVASGGIVRATSISGGADGVQLSDPSPGDSATAEPGGTSSRQAGFGGVSPNGEQVAAGGDSRGGSAIGWSSHTGGKPATGGSTVGVSRGGVPSTGGHTNGTAQVDGGKGGVAGRSTASILDGGQPPTGGTGTTGGTSGGADTGTGLAGAATLLRQWCNATAEWQGCGGPSNAAGVCREQIEDYPFYSQHNPSCPIIENCAGAYRDCRASSCPKPNLADQIDHESLQCAGDAGQWLGCRGSGCTACVEVLLDYPKYFEHNPGCRPNCTCSNGGLSLYLCSSECPAPTAADR